MNIEIYSKENCGQCSQAKSLITQKCFDYSEHMLGKDVTIQELQARVADVKSTKPLRSAPQIFIDNEHIGEYKDLVAFLANQEAICNN